MEGMKAFSPSTDFIYHLSLMLRNARIEFYTQLTYWVEDNSSKDLRAKVKMTEKNFLARLKSQTFTPEQIEAMMKDFVKNLSDDTEREL
jgi:hypothetical protein